MPNIKKGMNVITGAQVDGAPAAYTSSNIPDPTIAPVGLPALIDGFHVYSDGSKWQPRSIRNNSSIMVFGTSIENFTLSADRKKYPANGGVRIANSLMGWPWDEIHEYGVDGSKSPDFVARLPQTYADTSGWAWIGFPINDVIFDDVPLADTLANISRVYESFRLRGCNVIVNLGQPISAFSTDTDGSKKQRYFAIRKFAVAYAKQHDNFYLVDTAFAFTDVTMNSGFNLAAVTSDGIHDNYVGAFKKGTAIANVVSGFVKRCSTRGSAPQSFIQRLCNPLGIGDNTNGSNCFSAGSGITGTGPNQWQVKASGTGTAVGSRSTAALPADWPVTYSPQWVVTSTAANDGIEIAVGEASGTIMTFTTAWAASAALGLGVQRIPTVANGYYYTAIVSGTTAATEPSWPVVEGATIVDGGVKWLCRKIPSSGEQYYAEVEYSITAATGGVAVQVSLEEWDSSATKRNEVIGNYVDTALGFALPSQTITKAISRTPILTVGSGYTLKWMPIRVKTFGAASSSHTIEVHRVNIVKV